MFEVLAKLWADSTVSFMVELPMRAKRNERRKGFGKGKGKHNAKGKQQQQQQDPWNRWNNPNQQQTFDRLERQQLAEQQLANQRLLKMLAKLGNVWRVSKALKCLTC